MEGLRDFLRKELGDDAAGVPLSAFIRECYRELLVRADNGQKGRILPGMLQAKLRLIAQEFLKKSRQG